MKNNFSGALEMTNQVCNFDSDLESRQTVSLYRDETIAFVANRF